MKLAYTKHGDYYLPDLTASAENHEIGRFGRLHLNYLKQHKKTVYSHLMISGKLNDYLYNIDLQAAELLKRLMNEMSGTQGVTDELKARDQIQWVGMINNIRHSAEEIVLKELIYT